jgi:DNA-binding transcriptional LysR family regulator
MPLNDPIPDIRSLDLLHSVAELGSIRQAALRHHISQPAASMRLRSLEEVLNLQLLDRSHGRAQLTSAGIAVVQWGEEVLEPMRKLQLGTQALGRDSATHLRIVASLTVAEYLIPDWLGCLRAAHPDIIVSLQMGNSTQGIDAMVRGEADLGFVEGPCAPPELSSRVVRADDLVVVVDPSHKWARRKSLLTARELSNTPLVLRETGSGTREVLESAMHSLGLTVTPLVELASTTAIKAAVASGAGPGILSRLAIDSETHDGRLVVVGIDDFKLERSIRMVWSKLTPLTLAAKHLIQQIESVPSNAHRT